MRKLSKFQFWALTWFSRPVCDRQLYKLAAKLKPKSIAQFGLGNLRQLETLVTISQNFTGLEALRVTAVDLFEARATRVPGLTLKEAHRALAATGAKSRVFPGEVTATLPRLANQLGGTDLLIISLDGSRQALDPCWFFIPRMLHAESLVLVQERAASGAAYQILTLAEVEQLSRAVGRIATAA